MLTQRIDVDAEQLEIDSSVWNKSVERRGALCPGIESIRKELGAK